MNHAIELLLSANGDLLYRVSKYDRHSQYQHEIEEMKRTFDTFAGLPWSIESEKTKKRAIEQLSRMKSRLVTMLEDLLYIA
ncbi:hypothetical protein E5161_05505 [Cohnella pontilimi]|uniref:Uncharacterized protein n=1 Tax=Cohnella pontilimi TaxID=2564100 RepID=A0A4U0FEP5_9BACL|nr:hypothetical protein [Cohnella pontilimi]TJY43345.1 hypothetical protein E5161_05505 [Cohnella pontilimi]